MAAYFSVECPCQKGDKHFHKISNPDIIEFVPPDSSFEKDITEKIEENHEKNAKIFYYTCEKSNHKCKVWINTESGEQLMGKCIGCHP